MEEQEESRIQYFFERINRSLQGKTYKAKPTRYGCITSLLIILPLLLIITSIIMGILSSITKLLFSTSIFPSTLLYFGLFLFILLLVIRHFPRKKYKPDPVLQKEFKTEILPKLAKPIYPNIVFNEKYKTNNEQLKTANFFNNDFWEQEGNLSGEDAFVGTYKNIDLELAEITHYIEVISKGGWFIAILLGIFVIINSFLAELIFSLIDIFTGESAFSKSKQNFRGLFLYADFHKDFEGEIILRTRQKSILKKLMSPNKHLEEIIPENNKIKAKYQVYATTKQLGYYVLSPTIIEAIEKLTQELKADISLKLKDGKLYLIIPLKHNFFEIYKVKNNIIRPNTKEDILLELQTVKYLIETLNLETRIWSKV